MASDESASDSGFDDVIEDTDSEEEDSKLKTFRNIRLSRAMQSTRNIDSSLCDETHDDDACLRVMFLEMMKGNC